MTAYKPQEKICHYLQTTVRGQGILVDSTGTLCPSPVIIVSNRVEQMIKVSSPVLKVITVSHLHLMLQVITVSSPLLQVLHVVV